MSKKQTPASFQNKTRTAQRVWLSSLAFFLTGTAVPALADKFPLTVHEKQPCLVGRVTDSDMKPIESVQLKLSSPDNAKIKVSGATKDDGSFEISHDPCKFCQLEVLPPKGSGLASALLANLSGEKTRRLVIELRAGVQIEGKIIGNGKGLKGLDLSFIPIDKNTSKHSSGHGSGSVKTGRDGGFSTIVTPGINRLSIDNERYPEFAKHFDTEIKVGQAGVLPDVALPAASE